MTSLVTYLLTMPPPAPPPARGVTRHRIATDEDLADDDPNIPQRVRNALVTKPKNVEAVFAALEAGATTVAACAKRTGLARKTVQRALTVLERAERVVRDVPAAANVGHRFSVLEKS